MMTVQNTSTFPIHLHLAAMAPQFMDVRTVLPLRKLAEMPGLTASMSIRRIEPPRLPPEQPKFLIIQRAGVSDLKAYKASIKAMVEGGWIIISEFDDHPDLYNAINGRTSTDASWHSVRLAHAVQTSTPDLADAFRPYNAKVASFSNAAFRLEAKPSNVPKGQNFRIFFGALNRERFSSRIGAVLSGLAGCRRDIQFVVVHDRVFFDALGESNKEFYPALPYDRYLSVMGSCDVALMPLEGSPGEIYKSDVKFVEASSLGLVTMASPVVYGRTILDGVTGIIIPEVEGWAGALEALVSDRNRLLRVASAAYDYVADYRLFSTQIEHRLAWYRHLWDERIALTRGLTNRYNISR